MIPIINWVFKLIVICIAMLTIGLGAIIVSALVWSEEPMINAMETFEFIFNGE